MLKKFLFYHIVPLFIALCLIYGLSFFRLPSQSDDKTTKQTIISGKQSKMRGVYANLLSGENAELDYMASLKNKNQLTLFGSSEFSTSPFCTYNFLPDSMSRQVMGFGHAYHQHLSILIELLAANEYVDSSNICIFLSPGWFTALETNTEAFAEFARPNFLNKIINDTSIAHEYKDAIGEYLNRHIKDFKEISHNMSHLQNGFLSRNGNVFSRFKSWLNKKVKSIFNERYYIENPIYKVELNSLEPKSWNGNMTAIGKELQHNFVSNISTNSIFVNDDYFSKYLKKENKEVYEDKLEKVDIANNYEYKDFKLLVKYLRTKSVKVSFIIIPLNPYYYTNTEVLLPLIDSVTNVLTGNNIPVYNLYSSTKEDYTPGILKDVMHLGDYGWMLVNHYIDSLYYGQY